MKNIFEFILFAMALAGIINSPSIAQNSVTHDDPVINVIAEDYSFEAPNEIPSGWSNIQFSNKGQEPHLLLFSRLPEGKTVDDYLSEAGVPYNDVWYQLRDREISPQQAGEILGREVPEWFFEVQFLGGVGLVMPDSVAEATVNLPPGNYAIECYAKTEDGEIHFMEGMARPLKVTEKNSGNQPPKEDLLITITSDQMNIEGDYTSGERKVKVLIEEPPEQALGHNVHVIQLEQDADIEEVVKWMNWFTPTGLRSPSPDHATFIGGMHFLPPEYPAFFTVDLQPGRYLFVSDATAHFGVYKEITIE